MIKDRIKRLLFIPILAIVIPYLSGIFTYSKYSNTGIIIGFIFYLFVSFTLWHGCIWIHTSIRKLYKAEQGPFSKIALVAFSSSIFTVCLGGIYCLAWFRISLETFSWMPIYKFLLVSIFAVVLFTLIYEILFLSKERELDTKIVNQLDNELNRAEMIALKNELDPHFIYNSLNTLTHLIASDAKKAERYNQKLAQLYKYFLVTNSKELVTAEEEISFIKEYFGLL